MNFALSVVLLACAFPLLSFLVEQLFAKEFTTLKEGLVLITGASTGIGSHAAMYLANNTNYVVLAGVRKDSDMENVRQLNIQNLIPIKIDVAVHGSVVSAVNELKGLMKSKSLPLVAVVNNAGISRHIALENHGIEDIRTLFDTNLFGAIDLTQQLLPLLRDSKGRILMMSSVAGKISRPLNSMYAASKHAMESVSDALRREVAHMGISVSLIEPAYVQSAIFGKVREAAEPTSSSIREEDKDISWNYYDKFRTPEKRAKTAKALTKADDPIVTSTVVHHAITDPKPKPRYAVANFHGIPAWILTWFAPMLPDRILDYIFENM